MRAAATALAALLLYAAVALGGDGYTRQESTFELDQKRTGRASAEHFVFDYVNPADPGAKPPAVRRVVTVLPKGAVYDPSVPDSCTASDLELTAQGSAACPAGSVIGGGVITVDTGAPGPGRTITADVEFINNATDPYGEFIYLNTVRGTDARVVVRADVDGRRTITNAGMLPGTPPDGGAIDTVDVTVSRVVADSGRRGYVTTPDRCSKRRRWTTRVEFTYADGETQVSKTRNPCKRQR